VPDDCVICAKHRGEGPLGGERVWEDDHVVVFHAGPGFLGHLFVETKRHAPYVSDLTDAEAAAVGRAVAHGARALRYEIGAEFVISAVIGTGVAHFHQHLVSRYPDTPADVRWHESDEWGGAPHGDDHAIAELAARLRPYFD
jgi:ATP adenylyltransferase